MTPGDFQLVLQWWLLLFLIGLIYLPLSKKLFAPFVDAGYIFAKPLGIAATSYLVFLVGTLHLLPFTFGTALLALLVPFVCYSLFILRAVPTGQKNTLKVQLAAAVRRYWRVWFVEEGVFLVGLFFWSYIRGFNPDIHGLEKYMDFGFINSILRGAYFPPRDMWFTPFSINYYYFGHLMTAVLTRLSGISSAVTFNLMLATIFGLCFTESFSIGLTLFSYCKKAVARLSITGLIAGIISAALVSLAGNLHILYAFFQPYQPDNPLPLWRLAFQPFSFPNNYWYPDATRFIYHTIHEFPMYSWVVSDLHGHVLDIPFVLLTLGFTLSVFLSFFYTPPAASQAVKKSKQAAKHKHSLHVFGLRLPDAAFTFFAPFTPGQLVFFSFIVAIMYMTNAWDGLIYLLLIGLLLLSVMWLKREGEYQNSLHKLFVLIPPVSVTSLIIGIGFFIFSLPFSLFFKPFASGIGILCAPQFLTNLGHIGPFLFEPEHCQRSPWWQLLTLYGFFYFFVFSLFVFLLRAKKILFTDVYVIILTILATLLITIPEFVYVKDIYPEHYRANTMFKLVFQAFIILSLVSSYSFFRILSSASFKKATSQVKVIKALFFVMAVILMGLVLYYPKLAIPSYYNNLQTYQGLNGMTYLKTLYPDDYAGISWLNVHVSGQPVILEAQGDSYTDYGRVSTNTGLPTVLGWTVHEWLWRGTYSIPEPRISEIQIMYESPDLNRTKSLLKKYHVRYVFLGTLEREKYPQLDGDKFNQLGKIVFHHGSTSIYQLRDGL